MEKQIFKLLSFGFLLFSLFGCKKENVSPDRIKGVYSVYEIEEYKTGKIEQVPNAQGQSIKIIVELLDGNANANADVKFYLIENTKETLVKTFNFSVSKDEDGDYSLLDKSDNKLMAFFIDDEADFYFTPGYRLGARK